MQPTNEKVEKAKILDNWALLDLNLWSDTPQVDSIVRQVFEYIKKTHNLSSRPNIQMRNLKVVLLNLHAVCQQDPQKYVGVHRGKPYYAKLPDRYNRKGVKHSIIKTIDAMEAKRLVELERGHYDRSGKRRGHISRMRATSLMKPLFDILTATPYLHLRAPDTECIVLRKADPSAKKNVDVPYQDDAQTIDMRRQLTAYNNLLMKTYIDVPSFPQNGITSTSGAHRVYLDRNAKFVRRIFNNGTWNNGGRFYGGWWQRIPKEWRNKIVIHTNATVEIDYSGLHIVLLYAREGINFDKSVGGDPYHLQGYANNERFRSLLKLVLLTAINAANLTKAVQATNWAINTDMSTWEWVRHEHIDLKKLLNDFGNQHRPIKKYFFSGSGMWLQRIDGIIAELVINRFTDMIKVALCIHDSFVVAQTDESLLRKTMEEAFRTVVSVMNSNSRGISPKMKATDALHLALSKYIVQHGQGVAPFRSTILTSTSIDPVIRERLAIHNSIDWNNLRYTCN